VYRHDATGLPVLVRLKPGAAVSHVGVFARGGAAAEPADQAGVATISCRAALKGTDSRTAAQVAEAAELLGGSIGPSVSSDGLGFTLSVPTPRITLAIELLADVVQRPLLRAADVETERTILLSQLAQLRDDMFRYPMRLATQAAYGTHPYARGTMGSEESVRAIAPADVTAWLRERGADWVVGIVADGDPDALAAEALTRFAALRIAAAPVIAVPTWPVAFRVNVETREKAQTALALAFPGPSHHDGDRYASRLIAAVTSGLGGRFFDQLRDRQSLCYTVHASPTERVAAGLFTAYIAMSPEKEDVAREGLLREFVKLTESPVTADELSRAQRYVTGTHAIAQQHGGTQLAEMVDAWLFGEGLDELDRYDDRVLAQSPPDLLRVAQQYFNLEQRVEGIVRGTGRKV
jgi:zinc protease